IAEKRHVPAFVVLSDAVLRDIAKRRPASVDALRRVKGIGERKLLDLGEILVEAVNAYCGAKGLSVSDIAQPALTSRPNPARDLAFRLFERGRSVDQVAVVIGRAPSTAAEYLAEFVADRAPADVSAWVNRETYE